MSTAIWFRTIPSREQTAARLLTLVGAKTGTLLWLFKTNCAVPPRLSALPAERTVNVGERASITCSVISGDLPLTITWSKDHAGGPLGPAAAVTRVDNYNSVLAFETLGPRHTGNYSCEAGNHAARRVITQRLIVNGNQNARTETREYPQKRWTPVDFFLPSFWVLEYYFLFFFIFLYLHSTTAIARVVGFFLGCRRCSIYIYMYLLYIMTIFTIFFVIFFFSLDVVVLNTFYRTFFTTAIIIIFRSIVLAILVVRTYVCCRALPLLWTYSYVYDLQLPVTLVFLQTYSFNCRYLCCYCLFYIYSVCVYLTDCVLFSTL